MKKFIAGFVAGVEPPLEAGHDFCRNLVWKWRGHLEREELKVLRRAWRPYNYVIKRRGPRKTRRAATDVPAEE